MRVFKFDGFLAALIEITSIRSDRCFLGFRGVSLLRVGKTKRCQNQAC